MPSALRLPALAALALALLTGCAAQAPARPRTAAGCAAFAISALGRHSAITRLPAPCRGLGPAGLSQAVTIAVAARAARQHDKARRRHLAAEARARLAFLIAAAARAASVAARRAAQARRAAPAGPAAGPGGLHVPASWAALAAWLLAAGSGGELFRRWLVHRRRGTRGGARPGGPPPAVILGHAGLAVAGLVTWACYLATGLEALAWAAAGALLPAAGLGMATLVLAIPGPDRSPRRPAPQALPGGPAGRRGPGRAAPGPAAAPRGRMPALLIAAHGILATLAMLLALLAAIAARAG